MKLLVVFLLLLSLPLYSVEPVISLDLEELMLMLNLSNSSSLILMNSDEQIENLKVSQKNGDDLLSFNETAINNSNNIILTWDESITNFELNNNEGTILLDSSNQTINSLQTTTEDLETPYWKSPKGRALTWTLAIVGSFLVGYGVSAIVTARKFNEW